MAIKTVDLRYVKKLFRQINGGDDVDAATEAQEILQNLMKCARDVVDRWSDGDLAGAVNDLRVVLAQAERRDSR